MLLYTADERRVRENENETSEEPARFRELGNVRSPRPSQGYRKNRSSNARFAVGKESNQTNYRIPRKREKKNLQPASINFVVNEMRLRPIKCTVQISECSEQARYSGEKYTGPGFTLGSKGPPRLHRNRKLSRKRLVITIKMV